MEVEKVTSSYIKSVGYDKEKKKLQVEFKNGTKWQYNEVPESAYVSLLLAESTGKFFAKEIKGVYDARKLEDIDE